MSRSSLTAGPHYDVAPVGDFHDLIVGDLPLDGTAADYDLALTARIAAERRRAVAAGAVRPGHGIEVALNPALAGVLPDRTVVALQVPPGAWDLRIQPGGPGAHPLFVVVALLPCGSGADHRDPWWLAAGFSSTSVWAAARQWRTSANTSALQDRVGPPTSRGNGALPVTFPSLDVAAAAAQAVVDGALPGRTGAPAAFPRYTHGGRSPTGACPEPATGRPASRGPQR